MKISQTQDPPLRGVRRQRNEFLWWPTRCSNRSGAVMLLWLETIEFEEEYRCPPFEEVYDKRWWITIQARRLCETEKG